MERIYGGRVAKQAEGDTPHLSKYFFNLLVDINEEESFIRPEAAALASRRMQTMDTPTSHCLPLGTPVIELLAFPFKVFQTQEEIAVYYEANGVFRQIHIDGRKLPPTPFPSRMGYSTGKWEGDKLVVDTAGFNDKGSMDNNGHPRSEALHIQ